MKLSEFRRVLESVCDNVFYGEAAGCAPPYIVYREKTDTEFFGELTIAEVQFHTNADDDQLFVLLREMLAENGLVFSFGSEFNEDTKTITREAEICLPNAEIELVNVEYATNGIGCSVPVAFAYRAVPCVITEQAHRPEGKNGLRLYVTVRIQEGLYNGETRAELGGRSMLLDSARNSLNGSMRQTDIGYLELTFKEYLYEH